MINLQYQIEFHTDWHCGSGLSAGADVDSLVVKDENQLPFVPGKTIKGLFREAVECIAALRGLQIDYLLGESFGFFDDKHPMQKGCMFFTNAELPDTKKSIILNNKLAKYLYHDISNTAIGSDGVAKEHSLRKIQVTVPCTLFGEIMNVPDGMKELITDAMHYIKRLGQNRNRGLGRCTINIKEV